MPELPEVETVCRGLAEPLVGAHITDAEAHRANLRMPIPKNLSARLVGRAVISITRRAKYILINLDDNQTLLLHLGMSGRMTLSRGDTPLAKHDHISFVFDNGWQARFNDPRRFGMCDLCATDKIDAHKLFRDLGIEPLSDDFTPQKLAGLLKERKTTIKIALLDQRLVVGVGNIYACEALYRAGLHPERLAGSITAPEIKLLHTAIRKVLNEAIKAGGSSLRDYAQADGTLGYFQHKFAVYGKEGKPCPDCTCKAKAISRITQGGRSTFFCATKQK